MDIIKHMKRQFIANFIDMILIFLVTGFLSIAVIGYFVRDTTTILVAAFTSAVCLTALIQMFQKKRKPITNPEIRKVLTQFIYNDEKFAYGVIKDALKKKYNVIDKKSFLLVNSTAVFVRLKPGLIQKTEFSEIYGKARNKAKKIIILSIDGIDKDCKDILSALPPPVMHIFEGNKVYGLLNWLDSLPEIEIVLNKTKPKLKQIFKAALLPERARSYFFVSFILIFSSLFMAHSIYYIVIASVCLVLGLLSKINIISIIKKGG